MKSLLAAALCLIPSLACAQGTSIADFGASSDPGHDNTGAINRCLDAAAQHYFHCFKPPGWWHVKGSLIIQRETGQMGFGFDGPGVVLEDSSDLPILIYGGVGGQAPYIEANLQYAHPQSADMKKSACLHIDLPKKDSSVYNGWFVLQCTNAFHAIDQKIGSFWGNEIWLDCKNNSGRCIDLTTNKDAGAPNNHWIHTYINPVQTACPDGAEVQIQFASNTVFDDLEVNNSPCPIAATSNTRGVIYRNVRFEHGWIRDPKFAGHALIEATDDGVLIEQIEVQTIEVATGGDFSIFKDNGSYGPADTILGAANLLYSTLKSGHFYAISSPKITVRSPPFLLWYVSVPSQFSGQVGPNSPNVKLIQ